MEVPALSQFIITERDLVFYLLDDLDSFVLGAMETITHWKNKTKIVFFFQEGFKRKRRQVDKKLNSSIPHGFYLPAVFTLRSVNSTSDGCGGQNHTVSYCH